MSIFDELSRKDIQLKSYGVGNHTTTCPHCSASRKAANQKKPCLSVTISSDDTAVWKCHNCDWSGGAGKVHRKPAHNPATVKTRPYTKPEPKEGQYTTIFPKAVQDYFAKRNIRLETVMKNKIFYEPYSKAICFPYHSEEIDAKNNRQLVQVNIKHRNYLDKSKMWFVAGAKIPFYGLDENFYAAWGQSKEIIVVEGEYDKLALNDAGFWNVLSVPHGAPAKELQPDSSKLDFLIHAEEMIKATKKFIIAVDGDAPGAVLQKELVRRFTPEKCFTVTWPENSKDANDVLRDLSPDVLCDIINEAKGIPISGLYSVDDFEQSLVDFYNLDLVQGASTGFENIDPFYKVLPGRVTIITGIPYSGKSEWLDAVMINLVKGDQQKFAIFSPEHSKEEHVTKLIEKVAEKSADPKSDDRISLEEFMQASQYVRANFFFILSDDIKELPTIDWILKKAEVAVMRYGIKGLVIDPYNEIEAQRPNNQTEHEYIGKMLSKAKRFAKAAGIHIWIVAHPTKQTKDKDGNIQVPGGYDISGSANWLNKADNLIVVHRPGGNNLSEIHIKKVKPKYAGRQGVCNLTYEKSTGIYSVPESDAVQAQYAKEKPATKKPSKEERYYDSSDSELETFI